MVKLRFRYLKAPSLKVPLLPHEVPQKPKPFRFTVLNEKGGATEDSHYVPILSEGVREDERERGSLAKGNGESLPRRAGRRSTNSRGPEVERRDGRAKRNARTTAYQATGSLPARETDGREAHRAGRGSCERGAHEERQSEAGKPGGVKGGPGAESWSPIRFPSH